MKNKPPYYEINGRRYPAVTSILSVLAKPALVQWAANEASGAALRFAQEEWDRKTPITNEQFKAWKRAHVEKAEEAMDIGTWTHKLMDSLMRGEECREPYPRKNDGTEASLRVAAALAVKELGLTLIHEGETVWRDEEEYAGTYDAILGLGLNARRVLVDYKTSKEVWPEYHLQTAAYSVAAGDVAGVTADEKIRAILRLDKVSGKYQLVYAPDGIESDFQVFLAAKEIYDWQTADAKWRVE